MKIHRASTTQTLLLLMLLLAVFFLATPSVRAEEVIGKPFQVSIDVPGKATRLNGYLILPNTGISPAVLYAQGVNCKAEQTFDNLKFFASKGYAALAVDYETFPGGPSPDLIQAVKYLKTSRYVKTNNVSIVGFSQGARYGVYVAEYEPVKAVVAICGRYMIDGERIKTPQDSPITNVNRLTCPVFLIHAKGDPVVPSQNSIEMEKALKKANKKVQLKIYDVDTHWPGGEQPLLDAIQFIER